MYGMGRKKVPAPRTFRGVFERTATSLPLCGLNSSIRAQNGYGPHCLCKIVLLTLVVPRARGVTDLYL